MSALPVIERELRVQARRKSTFWLRVIAALLASLTAASTLSWAQQATWAPARPGKSIFETLSVLIFIFCLVEGVRQTADCLSQEKRDGTLGLLFLTDLRGFDVILGKAVAASAGVFYALLATFPAMAIALPAGGLSGGEFWRTQLVLLNSLFLALACGMWASARHRELNQSLIAGLKWVLLLTAVPALLEFVTKGSWIPSVSPGVALYLAGDAGYTAGPGRFWLTLGVIHLVAWAMLAFAGTRLASSWRSDASETLEQQKDVASLDVPPHASRSEANLRASKARLEDDPAVWLASRFAAHPRLVTLSVVIATLGNILPFALVRFLSPAAFSGLMSGLNWSTAFIPLLLLAFVASKPFVEARRNGSLELLLATPLSPEALVKGYWQTLWRPLRAGIRISALIMACIFVLSLPAALSGTGGVWSFYTLLVQLLQLGHQIARAVAVCWLGLYFGLKARSAALAIGHNLLWSIVVPWVANGLFWIVARSFISFSAGTPVWFWVLQFGSMAMTLLYSLYLIRWSKRQLSTRFRSLAAQP